MGGGSWSELSNERIRMQPKLTVISTNGLPDPPYPATTRNRGWHLRLDLERLHASDTWALAPPELRPWLLMLWSTAWTQYPAGSFRDDDAIIAARIGMPLAMFQTHRAVLMRCWQLASDGRWYHPVISELVLTMIELRKGETLRKANYRAKQKQSLMTNVPRDTAGTPPESHGNPLPIPIPIPKYKDNNMRVRDKREPALRGLQEVPAGFARFWAALLPKRRVDKVKCLALWLKDKLEAIADTIVTHVLAMNRTPEWQDGYNPAPLKYLRGRRWEDGLPEPPRPRVVV